MTEDIEALVERLRVAKNRTLGVGLLWHLCGTAADALTALAAERDALAAEVARLREALEFYANADLSRSGMVGQWKGLRAYDRGGIARVALAACAGKEE